MFGLKIPGAGARKAKKDAPANGFYSSRKVFRMTWEKCFFL